MTITNRPEADLVDIMPEARSTQDEPIAAHRRVTISLNKTGAEESSDILVSHGGKDHALTITLNRTVRVPDNKDNNSLPPGLGHFPLFKVRDYAHKMPEDMAKKGGVFFPMYQCEAMWINFSAQVPFAIKIYVGGVNAVSGFPMVENDTTREKRRRMLASGEFLQDYMVVPGQNWLDGIASSDGKIRQFVAKPKGSGFSVEAQVTGEEKVGGIQIEIIPVKKNLPTEFDVRFEDRDHKVINRTFNLAERGLTADSTWLNVKEAIRDEFDVAVRDQLLERPWPRTSGMDFSDGTKLGDVYFPANFSTLRVQQVVPTPPHADRRDRAGVLRHRCLPGAGTAAGIDMIYGGGDFEMDFSCEMSSAASMPLPDADDDVTASSYSPASPGFEKAAAPPVALCAAAPKSMSMSSKSLKKAPVESRKRLAAPAAPVVKEMGLAAGGFISQTIVPDTNPSDVWDIAASVMMNLQILDVESFSLVTGRPKPSTPINAETYASYGYPFFEIWGEEKTGIKGDFAEVKSIAQIEEERAKAKGEEYKAEASVPIRVVLLGMKPFVSTFKPVEILKKELEALSIQ